MRGVNRAVDHAMILQHFQPIGQGGRRDPAERGFQVGEAAGRVLNEFAQDLAGPARPDDESRARYRAEGKILLAHPVGIEILLDVR